MKCGRDEFVVPAMKGSREGFVVPAVKGGRDELAIATVKGSYNCLAVTGHYGARINIALCIVDLWLHVLRLQIGCRCTERAVVEAYIGPNTE